MLKKPDQHQAPEFSERQSVSGGFRAVRFGAEHSAGVENHRHESWHLLLLLGGACEEEVDGASVKMSLGDFRLSGPGVSHNIVFDEMGADCLVIHLTGAPVGRSLKGDQNYFQNDAVAADKISEGFSGLNNVRCVFASEANIREGVARIRRIAMGLSPDAPNWLEDAKLALHSPAARIGDVASSAKRSRERLSRAFQDFYGCSISEYRRFGAAARAISLIDGGVRKCEAALDAGFHDQSHMTRTLSSMLGLPPGKFRDWRPGEVTSVQ